MIILYDLAGADGERFSPNCWRTRMALAHKGLAHEARPVLFTEIPGIADGRQKTVPVIDDGGTIIGDSWAIADYLETRYMDRPSLFGGARGRALCAFVQSWTAAVVHAGVIELVLGDIYHQLDARDQPYFRASREKRFGRTLEAVQAGREGRVEPFRRQLQPLRMTLAAQPFLSGDTPAYADYLVFGAFQWARLVSDFTILKPDDPVSGWFGRCLDLYDGLGRKAQVPV